MLQLKNVSKVYGNGSNQVIALNNVDMRVDYGDFVAITGPSGSGKSTLLSVIGGLDRISSGQVEKSKKKKKRMWCSKGMCGHSRISKSLPL